MQPQNDEVGADMPSSYLQKLDLGAMSSSLTLLLLLFLLVVIIINKKRAEEKEAECTRDQKDVRAVQEREKEPDSPG
jgi:hypothetical protein